MPDEAHAWCLKPHAFTLSWGKHPHVRQASSSAAPEEINFLPFQSRDTDARGQGMDVFGAALLLTTGCGKTRVWAGASAVPETPAHQSWKSHLSQCESGFPLL